MFFILGFHLSNSQPTPMPYRVIEQRLGDTTPRSHFNSPASRGYATLSDVQSFTSTPPLANDGLSTQGTVYPPLPTPGSTPYTLRSEFLTSSPCFVRSVTNKGNPKHSPIRNRFPTPPNSQFADAPPGTPDSLKSLGLLKLPTKRSPSTRSRHSRSTTMDCNQLQTPSPRFIVSDYLPSPEPSPRRSASARAAPSQLDGDDRIQIKSNIKRLDLILNNTPNSRTNISISKSSFSPESMYVRTYKACEDRSIRENRKTEFLRRPENLTPGRGFDRDAIYFFNGALGVRIKHLLRVDGAMRPIPDILDNPHDLVFATHEWTRTSFAIHVSL